MKRFLLLALAFPTALLASDAGPGAPLIAADEAYDRDIQQNGEWDAAIRLALPESETFAPGRIKVLELRKGAGNPPPRRILPEHAWISCDGTAGVTFGKWTLPGTKYQGWYESVWAKMRDGSYKILLRRGGIERRKLHSEPGRTGQRADCTGKPFIAVQAPAEGEDYKFGASKDMTLNWTSLVTRSGEVHILVRLWTGHDYVTVLEDMAPAPKAR